MKDQYHAYLKRREEIKRHPFGNIWQLRCYRNVGAGDLGSRF